MNEELAGRILEAYGMKYTQALPMQKGYRNQSYPFMLTAGETVNLIIYKREPDMLERTRRTNYIADALAARGLPARSTYDSRILQARAGVVVKYAGLYRYLPGQTIPWEAYTMAHIKLLGETMSGMHGALQGIAPPAGLPHITDEYLAIVARMQRYFMDPNVQQAMAEKLGLTLDATILDHFTYILTHCKQLPNQQILHMDFVRGNILFGGEAEEPTITGIIDFEKSAWGHPLFDIARTLAFLLVDCKYKEAAKVRKYFLASGYNKRGNGRFKVTASNVKLLQELVGLFLIYDFYKFLRHNPYEYLDQNEHFTRTQLLLLKRKLTI